MALGLLGDGADSLSAPDDKIRGAAVNLGCKQTLKLLHIELSSLLIPHVLVLFLIKKKSVKNLGLRSLMKWPSVIKQRLITEHDGLINIGRASVHLLADQLGLKSNAIHLGLLLLFLGDLYLFQSILLKLEQAFHELVDLQIRNDTGLLAVVVARGLLFVVSYGRDVGKTVFIGLVDLELYFLRVLH